VAGRAVLRTGRAEGRMSDLVEKARAWDLLVARSTELQARIEELERLRSAEAAEAARVQLAMNDEIEELERALENLCIHVGMGWETDGVLETARAVLEKGKQPGAAESVGEEIENVAIVTRTVKAGQGRVEGEP
jgi:predicted transcriptional regulator